ncbi:hypothetical protein BLNAU_5938 [Blattamonas nauphoetae]|uniref:Ubiquitin-like domain-containing protein n=1 Tax=Blattamonas nauphoetae TaxID=2049346 RepID=A0ABQ9Y5W3_9EUKA|nr:hypothetical protein BLNAU_5938 [Blattamonas nauphoetae]
MQTRKFSIEFLPNGIRKSIVLPTKTTFEELECYIFHLLDLRSHDRLVIEGTRLSGEAHRLTCDDDLRYYLLTRADDEVIDFSVTTEGVRASLNGAEKLTPYTYFFPKDPERGIIAKEQLDSFANDVVGGITNFFSGFTRNRNRSPEKVDCNPISVDIYTEPEQFQNSNPLISRPFQLPTRTDASPDSSVDQTTVHVENCVVQETNSQIKGHVISPDQSDTIKSNPNEQDFSSPSQNPLPEHPDVTKQLLQMLQHFNAAVQAQPQSE